MISTRSPAGDPLAVARHHAATPANWPVQARFDPLERWYARITGDAEHEVWLLTWLPGQGTDLHDHGGCAGAFLVVSGALTEETVHQGRLRPVTHPAGAGRRFGRRHVHRVTNTGD